MSDKRMDFDEKRSFRRMFLGTQAECLCGDGRILHGVCENLSASGLLLDSDATMTAGMEVEVRIPSPTPHMAGFHARARVLRVDSGQQKRYRIALEITEVLD